VARPCCVGLQYCRSCGVFGALGSVFSFCSSTIKQVGEIFHSWTRRSLCNVLWSSKQGNFVWVDWMLWIRAIVRSPVSSSVSRSAFMSSFISLGPFRA